MQTQNISLTRRTAPRVTAYVLVLAAVIFAGSFGVESGFGKSAFGRDKDKPKTGGTQMVDKGSFGVFVKGQRVITESFTIRQENGASLVTAELKEVSGATPTSQKSLLEFGPQGDLLRYEWSQSGAATSSLTVVPNNEFLLERIGASGSTKAAEHAFLVPVSTLILDNNFFIHREVLAWRYLATAACHGEAGSRQCQPEEFGALAPQDGSSLRVRIELAGKEKVTVRGAERELLRLNLHGEAIDWVLWLDDHDQFKLIKVAIPADGTEVVRD